MTYLLFFFSNSLISDHLSLKHLVTGRPGGSAGWRVKCICHVLGLILPCGPLHSYTPVSPHRKVANCCWLFTNLDRSVTSTRLEKMINHANLTGFQARLLWTCGFSYELPVSSSFDWEAVELVQLGLGWSACRRGCLKGKTAHANPLLSPWDEHLSSCAACCPCMICCLSEWAASVHYVIFSIWVAAEEPQHCRAKTLSTQIIFILSSSWAFTVVDQILS